MTVSAEKVVPLSTGKPAEARLAQAIHAAIRENRARWAEARDAKTFLEPSWEFARILLAMETFAELEGYDALDLVLEHVPNLRELLPAETSLGEPSDPLESFLDAWEMITVPEGASSPLRQRIERAAAEAAESPPEPGRYGPRFARPESARRRRLLRVVELLQEKSGSQPVPIPQEVMAAVLGCHQTEVSSCVRAAERVSLLVRETKHNCARRRCAEYRFVSYPDPEIR